MTKHSKTNKKRPSDESDLDDMRESFRKHKEREQNGGGGGGSNSWDKLEVGKNMRRLLPRESNRKFYTEGWTHFNVGPNDKALRCIDEEHINVERGVPEAGTRCPLCKKFLREQARINSEYKKGDPDGQAEWKAAKDKYVPRRQYFSNVLRMDDDGDAEVKILAFGQQVWGQLMNYFIGDDTAIGDFTDPESGRWLNIKKVKKGGKDPRNVGYEVFPASESDDISGSWDAIKEAMHDLNAAAGKVLSKDEMIAIMKGIDVEKDDDDDDDSDDDASDSRSRKKSKHGDDDDDDDEAEADDSGDDEDDDDEDDRPVKVKGSKLAKNMKRRDDD